MATAYGQGPYGAGMFGFGLGGTVPTLPEVAATLGKPAETLQRFYLAEFVDQAARCRVDPYSDALAAALIRRVQHALAMDALPLGIMQDANGATRLGSVDPEVRRLEAPYRKLAIG